MLKFSNFLPLWFYVKSILADFKNSKTAILPVLKALNLIVGKNFTLGNDQICKNSKFSAAQMVKMAIFGASKYQNQFHVRSEKQKNPVFPICLASQVCKYLEM